MTVEQALAAFVLWRSAQFSTWDIARLLHVAEHDVDRALHVARDAERARR